ncbi:DoxX family protein [Mesorhizobium sp. WSM4307]|uniref:DoxX family protein n=1 Tax=unclassified Mesorhizobium TaxID=325217 RepID=UPI00115D6C5A|nr:MULTISPECIES: DoxX family protein [unclassified Mesorhizobium]TRC70763.1 DoxX family protein [Mesorhizobium sp. WSM4315]TRC77855.1 DoxX family protein [Mesorhizobium sp. WSM4307]
MHLRGIITTTKLSSSTAAAGWAPLPIRLIVGFGFLAHGYAKLSRGPGSFGVVLQTLGVPEPQALAWLTTLVELVGGGAVLAGAFIRLVSVPMAIVLLTALFTVHSQYGFFSVKFAEVTAEGIRFGPVGYEIILLYLAGLATLAVGGPGPLSLETVLSRTKGNERSK